jgi:serine/threonine-protein kinase
LYGVGRTLHAVPFNGERAEVTGPSIEVASDSGADFAVSATGSLVYVSGGSTIGDSTMVWIDRQGRERPLEAPPQRYIYPRLSPDRTRVAVNIAGSDRDVWIWDTRSKSLERLTRDPADDATLTWAPGGRQIIFGSARIRGIPNMFAQPADGSGEARRIQESARTQQPLTFAPDGRLLFSQEVAGRSRDILAMTMDESHRVQSLIDTPGFDLTADVSPDGRWIAYDSDESGRFEVYVRPYPDTRGGRWQISNSGGKHPRWSRDGRELYYRDLSTSMMAARIATAPTFVVLNRATLFSRADLRGTGAQVGGLSYDLGTDDEHFLMIKQGERPSLVLVQHWFGELMRLAPPS